MKFHAPISHVIRFAIIFAGVFVWGPFVSALSVHPAIHDVEIDPGATETRSIQVENDGSVTETYVLTIQKFIPRGTLGQQEFLDPADTIGLPEWMFVDRPEFTLAPGQTATLPVTIRIPANAPSGGYYAALFFSRKQTSDEPLAMLPRLGILFFVRVTGPAVERLSLVDFATDVDTRYEHLPIGFRVLLANEGNVHLVPQGVVTVKNMFGSTVARLRVNPEASKILPSSERAFTLAWTKGAMSDGEGFWQGLMREWSQFAIGRYRATLALEGAGFDMTVEETIEFSVWPWRTGVALVGGLIALILFYFVFKRVVLARATSKADPLR